MHIPECNMGGETYVKNWFFSKYDASSLIWQLSFNWVIFDLQTKCALLLNFRRKAMHVTLRHTQNCA